MSERSPAFTYRLTVRFRDCDLYGHVNNAVYFTYFEQTRLAWWRSLGGTTGFPGAGTVIVHAECDYRAPAFVHDELDVHLTLLNIGRSSVAIAYEIVNAGTGQRIAEGRTVNVTVTPDGRSTIPVPDAARALLTGR